MVDIRTLNDLVIFDANPLPLLSNIIANINKYKHFVVLDVAFFFINNAFMQTFNIYSRLSYIKSRKSSRFLLWDMLFQLYMYKQS